MNQQRAGDAIKDLVETLQQVGVPEAKILTVARAAIDGLSSLFSERDNEKLSDALDFFAER
jgi:hypothetical protein